MGTEATQPSFCSSESSTAYPHWVLLAYHGESEALGSADAATLATARTSTGRLIGVSLRLEAPPAVSHVRVHFPPNLRKEHCFVIAAHDDSFLIDISFKDSSFGDDTTSDYFVYAVSAAASAPPRRRLPSLSLLPPYYFSLPNPENHLSWQWHRGPFQYRLARTSTGLLRHGEDDELAVADLKIKSPDTCAEVRDNDDTPTTTQAEAELLLLRSGKWSAKRPPIRGWDSDQHAEALSDWEIGTILPVGDTTLCWADVDRGLLFCDVFDESPVLQYVPLPAEAAEPLSGPGSSRDVSVTGGSTVKFVSVVPRCCCGGVGSTHCQRSRHAYTINTWTLRMEDMVWVMDGMVDATELWDLDAYKGIPRIPLDNPMVSMDDPDVINFLVHERRHVERRHYYSCDRTAWLILVDTRRKAILSVARQPDSIFVFEHILPSRVSYHLNSNPSSSGNKCSSSVKKCQMGVIPSSPGVAVDEPAGNDVGDSAPSSSINKSAEPDLQGSAILEAFQDIPSYDFDRDDMLKAYIILSQDNGRRLTSLVRLPKNLRKDWLSMEIKATGGLIRSKFGCSENRIHVKVFKLMASSSE
ncbi:hypothetical protein BS78_09G079100 [Paspalum vaginatum]|nr:hypothetical protein BS78_09G079100 [Paspalum vaginatum]